MSRATVRAVRRARTAGAASPAVAGLLPSTLAAVSFLLLLLSGASWPGYAVGGLALLAGWWGHRPSPLGRDTPARLLLAAGVLLTAARETTGARWPLAVAGAVVIFLLLGEPLLGRAARAWYEVRNLPVPLGWAAAAVERGAVWLVNSGLLVLVGLAAAAAGPAWLALPPALAAAAVSAAVGADAVRRWRTRHRDELAELRHAIERHAPAFLLYFSAPPGSGYQATMWLPYLSRIGTPFLVVLPDPHHLPELSRLTGAPVVAYRSFEALDALLVPSLRAAFYVNNGMQNAHCVRYTRLTHVQLYHGDSDKAVTASPVNAMYDRIFVAGQAAVDRFEGYGVSIPAEKFRLVGRPQVEHVRRAERPIAEEREPVVLYAPTWVGAHADSNYCSLPIGDAIVEALLARGVTVIVRPHPYTERDQASTARLERIRRLLDADAARTGRRHRWSGPTLVEDMNASHVMICDVSSVASEYLYSGKPFALTDMVGAGDTFERSFPLARAAYVLRRDACDLVEVLDRLLRTDPLAAVRRDLRTYYLGDAPPVETFLSEARAVVSDRPAPGPASGGRGVVTRTNQVG